MLLAGHASAVARFDNTSSEVHPSSAHALRPKSLRREHVAAISSATKIVSLLTGACVRAHSSTRRVAQRLHIGKSRMHSLCDPERAESLPIADLLVLLVSSDDEGREVGLGILRGLVEYGSAADEVPSRANDNNEMQLELFPAWA